MTRVQLKKNVRRRKSKLHIEKRYLTGPMVRERFSITEMTLSRWRHHRTMNFPKPDRVINGRYYWDETTIEQWERRFIPRGDSPADDEQSAETV